MLRNGPLHIELFEVPGAASLPPERRMPDTDVHTHGNKHVSFAVHSVREFAEERAARSRYRKKWRMARTSLSATTLATDRADQEPRQPRPRRQFNGCKRFGRLSCRRAASTRTRQTWMKDRQGKRLRTVDMHAHILTPAVEKLVADCPQKEKRKRTSDCAPCRRAASLEHNNRVMPAAGRAAPHGPRCASVRHGQNGRGCAGDQPASDSVTTIGPTRIWRHR